MLEQELRLFTPNRPVWLTIGIFDGVHLGHQVLLQKLIKHARQDGILSVVLTFRQHPETVLGHNSEMFFLTTLEERIRLLKASGVDEVIVLDFVPAIATISALNFLTALINNLHMVGIVAGPDFALGQNREGNISRLAEFGKTLGFKLAIVPPMVVGKEIVSSTLIRQSLSQKDLRKVARLLGRPFSLQGKVIRGEGRGSTLGIPTTNIEVPAQQALPENGVYATRAWINSQQFDSVTNIGTRPTFGEGERSIETHIFDFDARLYGSCLRIDIIEQIRSERRFDTIEALVATIANDIVKAKEILKNA